MPNKINSKPNPLEMACRNFLENEDNSIDQEVERKVYQNKIKRTCPDCHSQMSLPYDIISRIINDQPILQRSVQKVDSDIDFIQQVQINKRKRNYDSNWNTKRTKLNYNMRFFYDSKDEPHIDQIKHLLPVKCNNTICTSRARATFLSYEITKNDEYKCRLYPDCTFYTTNVEKFLNHFGSFHCIYICKYCHIEQNTFQDYKNHFYKNQCSQHEYKLGEILSSVCQESGCDKKFLLHLEQSIEDSVDQEHKHAPVHRKARHDERMKHEQEMSKGTQYISEGSSESSDDDHVCEFSDNSSDEASVNQETETTQTTKSASNIQNTDIKSLEESEIIEASQPQTSNSLLEVENNPATTTVITKNISINIAKLNNEQQNLLVNIRGFSSFKFDDETYITLVVSFNANEISKDNNLAFLDSPIEIDITSLDKKQLKIVKSIAGIEIKHNDGQILANISGFIRSSKPLILDADSEDSSTAKEIEVEENQSANNILSKTEQLAQSEVLKNQMVTETPAPRNNNIDKTALKTDFPSEIEINQSISSTDNLNIADDAILKKKVMINITKLSEQQISLLSNLFTIGVEDNKKYAFIEISINLIEYLADDDLAFLNRAVPIDITSLNEEQLEIFSSIIKEDIYSNSDNKIIVDISKFLRSSLPEILPENLSLETTATNVQYTTPSEFRELKDDEIYQQPQVDTASKQNSQSKKLVNQPVSRSLESSDNPSPISNIPQNSQAKKTVNQPVSTSLKSSGVNKLSFNPALLKNNSNTRPTNNCDRSSLLSQGTKIPQNSQIQGWITAWLKK